MTPQPAFAPASPAPMGALARMIGVFTNPKETFADIGRKPTWIVPALVLMIVNFAFMFAVGQRIGWATIARQQIEKSSAAQNLSAEQLRQQIDMATKFASIGAYVGAIVGVLVVMVAIAAVLMLTVNILGGNVAFKQSLGVTSHASLIGLVSAVLMIIVLYAKSPEEFDINNPLAFNLAAFLGEGTSKAMIAFAKSFDLFSFATIAMLALGYSAVSSKMSFAKALTAVVIPWALFVACRVGWNAIF